MIGITPKVLLPTDWKQVAAIEHDSDWPMSKKDFGILLSQNGSMGIRADYNDMLVGFALCNVSSNSVALFNIGVNKAWRRCGIGTQLMHEVMRRLHPEDRPKLCIEVSERNIGAQLFLKATGFRANYIIDDFVKEGEAAYAFEYFANGKANNSDKAFIPVNRLNWTSSAELGDES